MSGYGGNEGDSDQVQRSPRVWRQARVVFCTCNMLSRDTGTCFLCLVMVESDFLLHVRKIVDPVVVHEGRVHPD